MNTKPLITFHSSIQLPEVHFHDSLLVTCDTLEEWVIEDLLINWNVSIWAEEGIIKFDFEMFSVKGTLYDDQVNGEKYVLDGWLMDFDLNGVCIADGIKVSEVDIDHKKKIVTVKF